MELLITVTILAILSSMVLFAMSNARATAREAKTRATITKLHGLLMRRWDTYRTRRVPVYTQLLSPGAAGGSRLMALRQIMRMEMPQRWAEVTTDPTWLSGNPNDAAEVIQRPALSKAYLRFYIRTKAALMAAPKSLSDAEATALLNQFEGAECLYLIVTIGMMDAGAGREQFNEDEIGDVDGDGAKEFIDGWGTPIRFLRWAPGFTDSRIQEFDFLTGNDPFDPFRTEVEAFALYPLIYSAGPDRIFDIRSARATNPGTHVTDNPFIGGDEDTIGQAEDLNSYRNGKQVPANGKLDDDDNIHNHKLETSLR